MSNYSLQSPIDVSSSGNPGQVNLIDSAGNFAVQLKSPSTLTTNVPFVLPNTNGSNSDYLYYGSSAAIWQTPIPPAVQSIFPFGTILKTITSNVGVTSTTSTYANYLAFGFRGSDIDGIPTAAYIVVGGTSATTCNARIIRGDSTVVAGPVTFNTTASITHISIPINTANVPTSALIIQNATRGVWYLQLNRVNGTLTAYYFCIVR